MSLLVPSRRVAHHILAADSYRLSVNDVDPVSLTRAHLAVPLLCPRSSAPAVTAPATPSRYQEGGPAF